MAGKHAAKPYLEFDRLVVYALQIQEVTLF